MEDIIIYYIYRQSDKRYKTYSTQQPLSNYTTIAPPQFNAAREYPYYNEQTNLWELKPHSED